MNAWIESGHWIVDCSADDCRAVLAAHRIDCVCLDESVCDHLAVPCGAPVAYHAVFPADKMEIERLLNLRSRRMNRNWLIGETVADLKAENLLHGVGI